MAFGEPNLSPVDMPAMEVFPTLKPLLNFDGSEVGFHHGVKKYIISTFDHETPDNPTVKNIVIGLWEVRGDKKIPVGFCDAWLNKLTDVVTEDVERHDSFENLPKDFKRLDDIQYSEQEIKDKAPGSDAFVLDVNYRGIGLADVFQAQTLAIFQGLGAVEVSYVGDITTHSELEEGHVPQIKSEKDGLAREQAETSFYSKWSTSHDILYDSGSHYTKVKPILSGMQISLLKQAGL